ncbi:MAG TPA: amidohydrolase family protein, partial [Blastocatellia bacterium]|nr:amidohydrolase family protein [Blastocatellia bacterium]
MKQMVTDLSVLIRCTCPIRILFLLSGGGIEHQVYPLNTYPEKVVVMMRSLAVINCSQLVTLAGAARPRVGTEMRELAIIKDGAMLARDGRIEAVGTRADIEPLITNDSEIIDAKQRVVLPGFVDAHAHPVFAGTRADEFALRAS